MKKIIRILSVSALLATAAAAQAQVYVEAAYTPLSVKAGGDSVKPAALSGIVGYEVNPNLAVEGFLGLGVKKVSVSDQDGSADLKVSKSFGMFLKPKVMLNDSTEVFARVGFAQSTLKVNVTDSEGSFSGSGSNGSFAYGLGGNYYLNKQTYLTGSYMSFYNKDGLKVTGFNLGAGYKF
jgi:Outer membrane protein beta-barrel domain